MNMLPDNLQASLRALTNGVSLQALSNASQEVTERYRSAERPSGPLLISQTHRLAYLTTRFPATFAAVRSVLLELTARAPDFIPKQILDLGAGPGTATWAASTVYPALQAATLVEQDAAFIELGKRLALPLPSQWLNQNITDTTDWPMHDLVVLSYCIGELQASVLKDLLTRAWKACGEALVVIEPGTPRGYETILRARDELIALGGRLIAPCPHAERCPMQGTKDWCHFSCRLARTAVHRHVKTAELGYEDEKYSYMIFTRGSGVPVSERIVRHPQIRPGHVNLELCTLTGLQKVTISKKQGDAYRWARKAEWGDGRQG